MESSADFIEGEPVLDLEVGKDRLSYVLQQLRNEPPLANKEYQRYLNNLCLLIENKISEGSADVKISFDYTKSNEVVLYVLLSQIIRKIGNSFVDDADTMDAALEAIMASSMSGSLIPDLYCPPN